MLGQEGLAPGHQLGMQLCRAQDAHRSQKAVRSCPGNHPEKQPNPASHKHSTPCAPRGARSPPRASACPHPWAATTQPAPLPPASKQHLLFFQPDSCFLNPIFQMDGLCRTEVKQLASRSRRERRRQRGISSLAASLNPVLGTRDSPCSSRCHPEPGCFPTAMTPVGWCPSAPMGAHPTLCHPLGCRVEAHKVTCWW